MKLLITGGTGTIGKEITKIALKKKYKVNILTRNKSITSINENLNYFFWNPVTKEIDSKCFEDIDSVINLAGFNVFNFWVKKNKSKILDSRLNSTTFILDEINKRNIKLKSFINASGISAYKSSYSNYYSEYDAISDKNNFINQVVINLESIVLDYKRRMPSTSFSIMRIGLVLSRDGGFYKISNKLARFYLLSKIGTGKQWQSWIHVNDVARAFLRNSKESWEGIYNLVAPNPVTHSEMLKSIVKHANTKIIFPRIPLKIVNLILGEMSQIIISSQKVNPLNLKQKKFKYNFINLDQALAHLSGKSYDNMA
jgi:uncharacterized protein (TIGR01777 family)